MRKAVLEGWNFTVQKTGKVQIHGGGNLQKKANNRSRSLPYIGPATSFFEFPSDDPERVLRDLRGEGRLFAEAEIAVARCDFARARELYGSLSTSKRYFLAAVRIGVVAAIGLGDLRLLDSVLKKVKQYRASVKDDSVGQKLADIVESWLRQWLWQPTGYPEWITRFDFSELPDVWRHPAAYLGVMERLNAGQFESAYAAAALLMSFDETVGESGTCLTASRAYLRMARAIACRETGREDEMRRWLSEMIRELAPHGFFLPFLIFMHCRHKSPAEEILAQVAPALVARYRELSRSYFANLIRARNHITGEKTTDELSYREFYLAMLLKRGLSYKELADRFGLSVGRIKNLLLILYQKLHIHSRSGINDLVW